MPSLPRVLPGAPIDPQRFTPGPFYRCPFLAQGHELRHAGCSLLLRLPVIRGPHLEPGQHSGHPLPKGRAGAVRPRACSRTRNSADHRIDRRRHHAQSLPTGANGRGFLGWKRRCGGRPYRAHGQCQRRGWLDSDPRFLLRPVRLEADPRPNPDWPRSI